MESEWRRERGADHEARINELEKKAVDFEARIRVLDGLKNWLLGAATVIGAVIGFFAKQIIGWLSK